MTWLMIVAAVRKYWRIGIAAGACIVLVWISLEFLDRGRDIVRLKATNAALVEQIGVYRANEITVEDIRRQVIVCLERVAAVQAESDDWQTRYEAARRRPQRVIRVPVEVAAPGSPCDEAVVDIAGWLAEEVTP